MKYFFSTLAIFLTFHAMPAMAEDSRPRLLVLTDIGGDPDDQQSLVRLLVYANEFTIEGLIASASGTPGELKKALVQPQLIRQQVAAYAEVYDNLRQNALGYPNPEVDGVNNGRSSVSRWRSAFQNEFQTRLDWCVVPPSEANHAPLAVVNGDRSGSVVRLSAGAGEPTSLDAGQSSDPDQDRLNYHWWVYPEAGTLGARQLQRVAWSDPGGANTTVTLPPGAPGATAHLILEVRDDGEPPLTRYRRVVLTRTD